MSQNLRATDPGLDFEMRGPEGVLQLHEALMPAFPNMKLDLEDLVDEGEKVLVRPLSMAGTIPASAPATPVRGSNGCSGTPSKV